MIIKKFQGKTEADAIEQAKKELGPNVVIMNVKNVKRKGLFSFLKPQHSFCLQLPLVFLGLVLEQTLLFL